MKVESEIMKWPPVGIEEGGMEVPMMNTVIINSVRSECDNSA